MTVMTQCVEGDIRNTAARWLVERNAGHHQECWRKFVVFEDIVDERSEGHIGELRINLPQQTVSAKWSGNEREWTFEELCPGNRWYGDMKAPAEPPSPVGRVFVVTERGGAFILRAEPGMLGAVQSVARGLYKCLIPEVSRLGGWTVDHDRIELGAGMRWATDEETKLYRSGIHRIKPLDPPSPSTAVSVESKPEPPPPPCEGCGQAPCANTYMACRLWRAREMVSIAAFDFAFCSDTTMSATKATKAAEPAEPYPDDCTCEEVRSAMWRTP